MSKKKISIEDANLFAKLVKEAELDEEADRNNPNWRMDLLGMVRNKNVPSITSHAREDRVKRTFNPERK